MEENQTIFKNTIATQKIFQLNKRIRAVTGGTSASKTISILVWHIDYAQTNKNKKMDIFAESYPHLNNGAIKDFKTIMMTHGYWEDKRWNSTNKTYTFNTNSVINFIAVDKLGKAKGPRRDTGFVNEANHAMNWEVFDQLLVRTKDVMWFDWNPSDDYWYYDKIKDKRDHDFLRLTYLDCLDALDNSIIQDIESHKDDKNWWRVYGEGHRGEVEGRIYKDWKIIEEIPHEARLEGYGLDFGYTNDPTVVVAVYYYNGGWILDECLYQKGMSNSEIANSLKNLKKGLVIADSAEPKSIDEIRAYGINIQPCKKGADSVRNGIQMIQPQPISITKRSVNGIKEYRNYMWATDRNGVYLSPNQPVKGNDHFLDAMRYKLETLGRLKQEVSYWDRVFENELNLKNKPRQINRGR
jgi:phage terminase large subunit